MARFVKKIIMIDLNEREGRIIEVASNLLIQANELRCDQIAPEFFFRFDKKVCHWVRRIRIDAR